jgi:hypothetical protein
MEPRVQGVLDIMKGLPEQWGAKERSIQEHSALRALLDMKCKQIWFFLNSISCDDSQGGEGLFWAVSFAGLSILSNKKCWAKTILLGQTNLHVFYVFYIQNFTSRLCIRRLSLLEGSPLSVTSTKQGTI